MVSGAFTIRQYKPGHQDIKLWLEILENFMLAEYGTIDNARKKAVLLTAIGEEAHSAIVNFTETEKDTYPHLVDKLKVYYEPHVNDFVERHTFYNIFQGENEFFHEENEFSRGK